MITDWRGIPRRAASPNLLVDIVSPTYAMHLSTEEGSKQQRFVQTEQMRSGTVRDTHLCQRRAQSRALPRRISTNSRYTHAMINMDMCCDRMRKKVCLSASSTFSKSIKLRLIVQYHGEVRAGPTTVSNTSWYVSSFSCIPCADDLDIPHCCITV